MNLAPYVDEVVGRAVMTSSLCTLAKPTVECTVNFTNSLDPQTYHPSADHQYQNDDQTTD